MQRDDAQSLGSIQRRLWRLVTEPDGVEAALAAEGAADGAPLAELIRSDLDLAPADRLAVSANAYFTRVHDCLGEDFPALARALGTAAFHDLVKTYLMMHPPSRPSLRWVGARLAEHLATEPFAEIFSRPCPYAADLARLEWALVEAFDAEDASVLAREDLAALAPEAWPDLCFETVPSLRVFGVAWPVQRVRERVDREDAETSWERAPSLVPEEATLLVWRQGHQVRYRATPGPEHEALVAASGGDSFAAICERMAESLGEAEAASEAAGLLSSWISEGLLARLR